MSRILKNSILNLAGHTLPLFIALAAVPVAVHGLGLDRFGVLSLAWTMLGYFAFFDLGLGRGTTRFFAAALSNQQPERLQSILWVSLLLNLVFGLVGGAVLVLVSPLLVGQVFKVPADLIAETNMVFMILASTIPMITMTAVLRGVLEAAERFDIVNAIKAPSNGSIFLIPLLCVPFGMGLEMIVVLMALSRLATTIVFWIYVARLFPRQTRTVAFRISQAAELLRYGGWVTLTNILAPIILYGERLLIASVLSLAMLSYYSAPFELISRLAIIPSSLSLTLFPMFSAESAKRGQDILHRLIVRPSKYLVLVMAPIAAFFIAGAPEILQVWLGSQFSEVSSTVLQILTISAYFNALAYVPLAAVQGLGRPDLKAKLDIVATVLFGLSCWTLILSFGITGAAWAKLLVTVFDAVGLLWCTVAILGLSPRTLFHHGFGIVSITSVAMLIALLVVSLAGASLPVRAVMGIVLIVVFLLVFFKTAMNEEDKAAALTLLARARRA